MFVMLSWDIRENDTESFTGTMLLFSLLQFLQLQLACFTDSLFWSRQFLIWVFCEKTHGNCLKRIRMHIGGEGFQGSLKQSSFSCMSARELLKSDSAIICEIQLILASLYAEKRLLNYFSFIYECIFTLYRNSIRNWECIQCKIHLFIYLNVFYAWTSFILLNVF